MRVVGIDAICQCHLRYGDPWHQALDKDLRLQFRALAPALATLFGFRRVQPMVTD